MKRWVVWLLGLVVVALAAGGLVGTLGLPSSVGSMFGLAVGCLYSLVVFALMERYWQ